MKSEKDWYGMRQTFSNSEELANWFARREFLDENDKPRGLIKIVVRPTTESRGKWSVTCTFKKLGYPVPSDKE
jgi:hypothetical protein